MGKVYKMDKKKQTDIQNKMIDRLVDTYDYLALCAGAFDKMDGVHEAARLNKVAKAAIQALANEINGGDVFN